jgi:hypothetical protein
LPRPVKGKQHRFAKGHKFFPVKPKPPVSKEPEVVAKGQSAKFRNDLFWIYKNLGGKEELVKLIKGSKNENIAPDKGLLKDLLKLLLALYTKELDAETKKEMAKGAAVGNGKNFIFFMDGLGRKESSDTQTIPEQILSMMTEGQTPDA